MFWYTQEAFQLLSNLAVYLKPQPKESWNKVIKALIKQINNELIKIRQDINKIGRD